MGIGDWGLGICFWGLGFGGNDELKIINEISPKHKSPIQKLKINKNAIKEI